jgi:methyl-accepting chemotaxis protein
MNKQHKISTACRTLILASGLAFTALAYAGQESTIFSFVGQDFVRTKTTLKTQDGKSAVNTKLDHNSPAYKALLAKHSYSGDATVFGQKCDASYAPLTDAGGQLTGALFVGICGK